MHKPKSSDDTIASAFDARMLREALKQARRAGSRGECPVGAVLVRDGVVVARAGNEDEARHDPTAHAEILVLRRAGRKLMCDKLTGAVVYTTLWPCPMCLNAMLQAGVARVVSAARSVRWVPEVRFRMENIRLEGPHIEFEAEGRGLFLDWLQATGRQHVLARSEPWP